MLGAGEGRGLTCRMRTKSQGKAVTLAFFFSHLDLNENYVDNTAMFQLLLSTAAQGQGCFSFSCWGNKELGGDSLEQLT